MSTVPLASDLVAVVVRGDFRPVVISPAWLKEKQLIGEAECSDSAFEALIPNEVSIFRAGWLRCQNTPDMLQFQTDQEAESERLRDLTAAVLRELDENPISQLGINRHVHAAVSTVSQWNSIGDSVVRNDMWGDVLNGPGMRSVTYWANRTDSYGGRIQVQIEPSALVAPGLYVSYNDHYDLTRVEFQPQTRAEAQALNRPDNIEVTTEKVPIAIEVLTGEWGPSLRRSVDILEQIWKQANVLS